MTQKANAIPPQKVKQSIAPTPIIHRISRALWRRSSRVLILLFSPFQC